LPDRGQRRQVHVYGEWAYSREQAENERAAKKSGGHVAAFEMSGAYRENLTGTLVLRRGQRRSSDTTARKYAKIFRRTCPNRQPPVYEIFMNLATDPDTLPPRGHPAKRLSVLDAAAAVFCREGFGGANIDLIAAEAGVSRQTIYNHHGDKQSLFMAV